MLPVMISHGSATNLILKVIALKVIIGMLFGFIIDFIIFRKRKKLKKEISKICEHDNCHCEKNILLSSLKHTLNIFTFIVLVNIIMNVLIYFIGEEHIKTILVQNKIFGPIISGIVGLIPNCAASVVITELFLKGAINCGSLMSGLLSNSGVAIIILFRLNKNYKENFIIMSLVYFIAIFVGILINMLNIVF